MVKKVTFQIGFFLEPIYHTHFLIPEKQVVPEGSVLKEKRGFKEPHKRNTRNK